MYMISLSLKYKSKILNIAYLLMLKLLKDKDEDGNKTFQLDLHFIKLFLKVVSRLGKYGEAINFFHKYRHIYEED